MRKEINWNNDIQQCTMYQVYILKVQKIFGYIMHYWLISIPNWHQLIQLELITITNLFKSILLGKKMCTTMEQVEKKLQFHQIILTSTFIWLCSWLCVPLLLARKSTLSFQNIINILLLRIAMHTAKVQLLKFWMLQNQLLYF